MKTMKKLTGFAKAQIMQAKTFAIAFFISLAVMGQAAHANTNLEQIGTQIATAIGQFVAIITAIGLAGVSVVVMVTAFKMAFNFVKTLK